MLHDLWQYFNLLHVSFQAHIQSSKYGLMFLLCKNGPVPGTNTIIQVLADIFVLLEGSNRPIVDFLIQGMHITSTILWCKCRVLFDNCDI